MDFKIAADQLVTEAELLTQWGAAHPIQVYVYMAALDAAREEEG